MRTMSHSVEVEGPHKICDMPTCNEVAEYDAKSHYGPWGNFCADHFRSETPGLLGTGRGQKLIYVSDKDDDDENEVIVLSGVFAGREYAEFSGYDDID